MNSFDVVKRRPLVVRLFLLALIVIVVTLQRTLPSANVELSHYPALRPVTHAQRQQKLPNNARPPNPLTALASKVEAFNVHREPGNYVVNSCSTPESEDHYNYAFYLPLTVIAWRKVGFESIVVLIGRADTWRSSPSLKIILDSLLELDCTVLFLGGNSTGVVMLSQTIRLFVAELIVFENEAETYLITSDVDLWPFNRDLYLPRGGKKIVSLNSACCGSFKHKEKDYRMLPISNIGMNVSTWKEVMRFNQNYEPALSLEDNVVLYFRDEVGDVASLPVKKGVNAGWYMDQTVVSVRVEQWVQTHEARDQVAYIPRDTWSDRLDRSRWLRDDPKGFNDSHLLIDAFKKSTWMHIHTLLSHMTTAEELHWCEKYREYFVRTLRLGLVQS